MKVAVTEYTAEQYEDFLNNSISLFDKYAHLISKTHCGLDLVPGWLPIIEQVLELLDSQKSKKLHIQKIANDHGVMRIYYEGGDAALHDAIDDIESESLDVCEMCGLEGRHYHNTNGTVNIRCKWHADTQWSAVDPSIIKAYEKKLKALKKKFTTEWE